MTFAAFSQAAYREEIECFDADVSATIERQIPTFVEIECGGCIVMRWPWIVDLQVLRVRQGSAPTGPLSVLTVQHSDFRTDLGSRRWLLRRNSLQGFNAILRENDPRLPRCAGNAEPARPFIEPGEGRTLEDVRREGAEHFNRDPR